MKIWLLYNWLLKGINLPSLAQTAGEHHWLFHQIKGKCNTTVFSSIFLESFALWWVAEHFCFPWAWIDPRHLWAALSWNIEQVLTSRSGFAACLGASLSLRAQESLSPHRCSCLLFQHVNNNRCNWAQSSMPEQCCCQSREHVEETALCGWWLAHEPDAWLAKGPKLFCTLQKHCWFSWHVPKSTGNLGPNIPSSD